MTTKRQARHRTICMSQRRARQLALASAYLGMSGEQLIQTSITSTFVTLARHDKAFGLLIGPLGEE